MSDDKDSKTLPPTEKRKKEFRDRGEVALSRDMVGAVTFAGGAWGLVSNLSTSGPRLTMLMRNIYDQLDTETPAAAANAAVGAFIGVCGPIAIHATVACLVAMAVQLGWPPVLKAPSFNFAKPFSFGGLPGLISPKAALFRVLMSVAKIGFVGGAAWMTLSSSWQRLATNPGMSPSQVAAELASLCKSLMATAGGAFVLLSVLDFIKNKRDLAAKMRMSREEMKTEYKQSEGDPHMKGKRKRRMRELARRRLATTVPTADVVLVNPTEYAVALRYRAGEDGAPRVLAKGRGPVAERIRELARQAGVPIVAEPPLTRLIHKLVPEGKEIPGELFSAVAEVLAYVYKLRRRLQ
jgi:flagellar biosynthesis protein FlhB